MIENYILSIIIINYNNTIENICNCIESVIEATGNNQQIEIICVDDGSTNESVNMLRSYEKNIKNLYLYEKQNGGPSSARNYGMQYANGDWIWFIDGDDNICKDSVGHLLQIVSEYNEYDVVYFAHNDIIENQVTNNKMGIDERFIQLPVENKLSYEGALLLNPADYRKYPFLLGAVWDAIYKKERLVTEKINFDEELVRGEDALFNLNVIRHSCKIGYYDEALYNYVIHQGSICNDYKSDIKIYLNLISAAYSFCKNSDVEIFNHYKYFCSNYIFEILKLHFFHKKNNNGIMNKRKEFIEILKKDEIKIAFKGGCKNYTKWSLKLKYYLVKYKMFYLLKFFYKLAY